MGRKSTGNVFNSRGAWFGRVTVSPDNRPAFLLPTCKTEEEARARASILAELAAELRAAGHVDRIPAYLEQAAKAASERALAVVREAVRQLAAGAFKPPPEAGRVTLKAFGERWTSGALARSFPAHIKAKRTAHTDASRLETHVYPIAGEVYLDALTLDHALAILAAIPEGRSDATRRHVAQLLNRLLALAVFPARLIPTNPLPKGFLPRLGAGKAKGSLYPDEDARLLASPAVPLAWRVFYGFLHREGLRASEAIGLDWGDVDLDRGGLALDENKTNDPRAWALDPGVVLALSAWRELRGAARLPASDPVFVDEAGRRIDEGHLAEQFRDHLKAAGITREALFERSSARRHITLHDTRATFCTIALANGRSETWVQDRTGHKSSLMINRYRRAARQLAELGLGELEPLGDAIPELREVIAGWEAGGGEGEGGASKGSNKGSAKRAKAGGKRLGDADSSILPRSSPGRGRTDTSSRTVDFKSTAYAIPPRGQSH